MSARTAHSRLRLNPPKATPGTASGLNAGGHPRTARKGPSGTSNAGGHPKPVRKAANSSRKDAKVVAKNAGAKKARRFRPGSTFLYAFLRAF